VGGRWWVVMVMMVVGSGANAELIASELLPVGRRIIALFCGVLCGAERLSGGRSPPSCSVA